MNYEMKNDVIENAEVTEKEAKTGFISKVGAGIKKHGKTIAGIAVVGLGALVGFAIGRKSTNEVSDSDIDDSDVIEDDFEDSDEETE